MLACVRTTCLKLDWTSWNRKVPNTKTSLQFIIRIMGTHCLRLHFYCLFFTNLLLAAVSQRQFLHAVKYCLSSWLPMSLLTPNAGTMSMLGAFCACCLVTGKGPRMHWSGDHPSQPVHLCHSNVCTAAPGLLASITVMCAFYTLQCMHRQIVWEHTPQRVTGCQTTAHQAHICRCITHSTTSVCLLLRHSPLFSIVFPCVILGE